MSACAFDIIGQTAGMPGEPETTRPHEMLSLCCTAIASDEVMLSLAGDLDIASAEQAFGYARAEIDRHAGAVVLDLARLEFCDAHGLGTLLRIRRYAREAGRAVRLMSPQPQLRKIMRITGLYDELLSTPARLSCL